MCSIYRCISTVSRKPRLRSRPRQSVYFSQNSASKNCHAQARKLQTQQYARGVIAKTNSEASSEETLLTAPNIPQTNAPCSSSTSMLPPPSCKKAYYVLNAPQPHHHRHHNRYLQNHHHKPDPTLQQTHPTRLASSKCQPARTLLRTNPQVRRTQIDSRRTPQIPPISLLLANPAPAPHATAPLRRHRQALRTHPLHSRIFLRNVGEFCSCHAAARWRSHAPASFHRMRNRLATVTQSPDGFWNSSKFGGIV